MCFAAVSLVPVKYQAQSIMLLVPPRNTITNNPYLNLNTLEGLNSVLAQAMSASSTKSELNKEGARGTFTVTTDAANSGLSPLVVISAVDTTRSGALDTVGRLVTLIPATLQSLQDSAGVTSPKNLVTILVLNPAQKTAVVRKSQTRALIVALAFGLLLTVLSIAILENVADRRRRATARRPDESAGDLPADDVVLARAEAVTNALERSADSNAGPAVTQSVARRKHPSPPAATSVDIQDSTPTATSAEMEKASPDEGGRSGERLAPRRPKPVRVPAAANQNGTVPAGAGGAVDAAARPSVPGAGSTGTDGDSENAPAPPAVRAAQPVAFARGAGMVRTPSKRDQPPPPNPMPVNSAIASQNGSGALAGVAAAANAVSRPGDRVSRFPATGSEAKNTPAVVRAATPANGATAKPDARESTGEGENAVEPPPERGLRLRPKPVHPARRRPTKI